MLSRRVAIVLSSLAAVLAHAGPAPADEPPAGRKLRVLIVDGQNNHDWRTTTPQLKKALEESGRFTVDVTSNLPQGDKPGRVKDTLPFPSDQKQAAAMLGKYDVVLSNYNGAPWPEGFQKAFEEGLRDGKFGLVIVHAANNAFGGWGDYDRMIGMGWRDRKAGERLKLDDRGKEIRVPAGKDDSSGHRYVGEFTVTVRDADHPITKGMPAEWRHARDELYDNLRGPIENVHLLATAYSPGTKAHEPMIWTVTYGKGRVFHTPMGHDLNGMRCRGFIATLQRGTEWAATGKVTLPLPADFPTASKASSEPAK